MIDTTNNQIKIETSIEQVERVIRDLIDKDLSVYISYEHNASFVDKESGIMSLSAFHFPKEAAPLSRELRARYNVLSGGHAVQVVGYDLDVATQKVRKWKIKNSWGEKSGDKGYYHMYDDYFKTYIKAVSFLSDVDIQLPKAEEIKPQQLDLF